MDDMEGQHMAQPRHDHDTGPNGVTVDDLIESMAPFIHDLLGRIDGEEFTTNEFVELMLSIPEGVALYEQTLIRWGERERQAKMVVHGQVIPAAMRRSSHVEWIGFAHGADDTYGVPAWWRLVPPAGSQEDTARS
jgi:hypothetical protein